MYYKDLLRHRQIWIGAAMLWIILFHFPMDLEPIKYIKKVGYGGVDICFFASGIGCFFSLTSEPDIMKFMKRRLKRLAPTYVLFIIVWLIFQYLTGTFYPKMALGNLLALQNFTGLGDFFNWYISAIILFYLLAPYFKGIIDLSTPKTKGLFLVFLFVCSIPFWKADTYIITLTRLPIFYMGMLFGDMCRQNKQMSRKHVIYIIVSFLLGVVFLVISYALLPDYLWTHGLYWYPFILITPPLCIAISWVSMLLEKRTITKPILSLLSLCGDYSFELYLVHLLLVSCYYELTKVFDFYGYGFLVFLLGGTLLVISCFALRYFTTQIMQFLTNHRKKIQ